MKILRNYIALTVVYATLLVLFLLVGLQIFILFVAQMADIGKGAYGIGSALSYVFLMLPLSVYMFFPMVGLIGSLLGLGYLASSHELVVMRTAGVSVWQVTRSVFFGALSVLIVITVMGEWLGPAAMRMADMKKTIAKSGGQALDTQQGMWARDGDRFIHIRNVLSKTLLLGVTQYQFDANHRLKTTSFARQANYHDGAWWLSDVQETNLGKKSTMTRMIDQEQWLVQLKPELFQFSTADPNAVSLSRLQQLIADRKANGFEANSYLIVFWQRVFQPFATLAMILLAIPFIFGPLRSVSMGLRLVTGISVSFFFYLLNRFLGPFSLVYQLPPLLGALLPSLIFLGIGLWLMRRVR